MSLFSIFVLTIVASIVLVEQVQPGDHNQLTMNEILGVWYVVGLMRPRNFNSEIFCEWFDNKQEDGSMHSFTETHRSMINGKRKLYWRSGSIIDSQLHITNTSCERYEVSVYSVLTYRKKAQMILVHKADGRLSRLVSRSLVASSSSRLSFEGLASSYEMKVVYVNNTNC